MTAPAPSPWSCPWCHGKTRGPDSGEQLHGRTTRVCDACNLIIVRGQLSSRRTTGKGKT